MQLVLNRSWWGRALALAPRYWVVADQAIVSGTTFLTNLFLARLCGLTTFGEYSGWQLLLLLVLTVQGALITQPMQLLHGTIDEGDRAGYRRMLLLLQSLLTGLSVVLVGLGLWLMHRPLALFPAFALMLVTAGALDTARKLLLADGQVRNATLMDAVSGGLQLVALLGWSLSGRPATVEIVLWIVGLTTLPALALAVPAFALGRGPITRAMWQRHFRPVRWLLPTAGLQWAGANALLVFVGVAQPPATLGVLRLAQTVMGIFNVALQAVENYLLPRLSRLFHHDYPAFRQQLWQLGRMLLLGGGPILALVFTMAGPLVRIVQPQAVAYTDVLRWCSVLYLTILLVYPLRLTVRLIGHSRPYFVGYLLSLTTSLLAARPLLAHWPTTGVVMGWLLAQLVLGLYWGWVVVRHETVRHETIRHETVRPETVRPETVRPETIRPETVRPETVRPETVRPQT